MFISQFSLLICFLSVHFKGNPIVIIESEFSTKSVNDAGTLILKVFVSGNPEPSADNITWYLNNELLTSQLASSKGFEIYISKSSVFITPDNGFQLSMEGKYECYVTSLAGTATASNTLDIHCELICNIIKIQQYYSLYNGMTICIVYML